MSLKFGTSGVRGLVSELTDQEVYLFTTAFLKYAEAKKQLSSVAVAHDLRESSPGIQNAAIAAINDFGKTALLCGTLPTPALAYYAQCKNTLAIMITGSHIPADRNGIKFYLETGETLKTDDQLIFALYETLKGRQYNSHLFLPNGVFKNPKKATQTRNVTQETHDLYVRRYLSYFTPGSLEGLKILFYQHSSVARDIFPEILENLGAEVIRIGKSDTFVPVDTEAVESLDLFRGWIKEHHADALVSTDGDADRPLLVHNEGNVIPGDQIGALTSLFLKAEAIALPISCNSAIAKLPNFQEVVFTKIGSPYVVEALNNLSIKYRRISGFEANGGYLLQRSIFSDIGSFLPKLPTRDAVLPILSVLTFAQSQDLNLAELVRTLPPVHTCSILVKNFSTNKSVSLLKEVAENPKDFFGSLSPEFNSEIENINNLDGLRFIFKNDEVIHLRPSGNAPEFRCYTEAATQERADYLGQIVLQKLLKYQGSSQKNSAERNSWH